MSSTQVFFCTVTLLMFQCKILHNVSETIINVVFLQQKKEKKIDSTENKQFREEKHILQTIDKTGG